LNGDIFNPEVDGLEGVIESYKHAINNINFYGPTYFAPVIKMVVDMAESERVS
jgi:vacuolar-type H+-ATPase subunit F/Vma7